MNIGIFAASVAIAAVATSAMANVTTVQNESGVDFYGQPFELVLDFTTATAISSTPQVLTDLGGYFQDGSTHVDITGLLSVPGVDNTVTLPVSAAASTNGIGIQFGPSNYGVVSKNPFDGIDYFGGTLPQLGASYLPYALSAPEPTTWALMLIGFGFVGFAVRRRQTSAFA